MSRFPIVSLHHVTATVDAAQPDLVFCAKLLGLRLVKRTVNFDNTGVYHFYYGDRHGSPGTIWTSFPYHGMGVPPGRRGAGQVTATSFSVPEASLGFWRRRLRDHGVPVGEREPRFGAEAIRVLDPSGLAMDLVATPDDSRPAWTVAGIDPSVAVRGLAGVTLSIRSPADTIRLLTDLLTAKPYLGAAHARPMGSADGGARAGAPTLQEQAADAESRRDWKTSISAKNRQLVEQAQKR